MSPIEQIKANLKIADLIAEDFTVTGRGRVRTTTEHDSLKIYTDTNTWYWYSQGKGSDLLDWWQHIHRCDFDTALHALAEKAGVELRPLTVEERAAIFQQRSEASDRRTIFNIAAGHYHYQLKGNQTALDYCYGRGWNDGTINTQLIGYNPNPADKPLLSVGDDQPLAKRLRAEKLLDHPLAKAVLSLPAGHLVYVHRCQGEITYLSARSIEGKRHWNLPADLAGPRQPYHANPLKPARGVVILCEGQADAISLGQLGFDAIALCGVAVGDTSLGDISHVALDNDSAGQAKALDLGLAIGPFCRLVTWPKEAKNKEPGTNHVTIKDANDLLRTDLDINAISALLDDAQTAIQALASKAGKERDKDLRKDLVHRFFAIYSGLDKMDQTDMKQDLAQRLCGGMSQFQRMWKAYQEANKEEEAQHSERHVISPGGFVGGFLFEMCVETLPDGEKKSYYWVRKPDGTFAKMQSVIVGNTAYWPIDARDEELLEGDDVLFASDREESGSELELLKSIRAFIHYWLDVPAYYENIASYYVLLSWFYDAGYETLPYLRALGEYGTGKTRFIMTIGFLCFRPMIFGGGDSEATLYYTMQTFKGTMVVDESDFTKSDESALIAKIINMGNQRKGSVKRMEPKPDNSGLKVKRFGVFGPKIFGARSGFGDSASDSRCLTHYTTAIQVRGDIPADLTEEFYVDAQRLRNRLLDFRLKHWKPVKVNTSDIDRTIMPRLAQITLALKSIIHDPTVLDELVRFVRLYNQTLINDRQSSDPAIVVEALVHIRYPKPTVVEIEPDWSISNVAAVAEALGTSLDPDMKFSPKKTGYVLSKQLGLFRRGDRASDGKITVVVEDTELTGLMNRYGIHKPKWCV